MYWMSAAIIGGIGGGAHGYKRSHGGIGATCRDAIIGGLLYPLAIPVLPLTAFKPSILSQHEICKSSIS